MKAIFSIFLGSLFVSFLAHATESLRIHGVDVQVQVDSRFSDGRVVSGSLRQDPVEIPMSGDNSILLKEFFWLGQSGNLTLVASPGDVKWTTLQGLELNLDCDMRSSGHHRMVGFHEGTREI